MTNGLKREEDACSPGDRELLFVRKLHAEANAVQILPSSPFHRRTDASAGDWPTLHFLF